MKILEENEKIITQLKPHLKFRLKPEEWIKIPFSIIWFSMICFFLVEHLKSWIESQSLFDFIFSLILILFFLIGLYVVFIRFILKIIEIRNSIYYITNSSLIIHNQFWDTIKKINYEDLNKITLRRYDKKFGFIIFGEPEQLIEIDGNRNIFNFTEDKFIFENITNIDTVKKTIEKAKSDYEKEK